MLPDTVDAIEPIKRPVGRPRKRPAKLHADKAYDSKPLREELRRRSIRPRIARRGIESSERLGKHRWVVERMLAWLNRYRRLRIRHERRAGHAPGVLAHRLRADLLELHQPLSFVRRSKSGDANASPIRTPL
jgi:transposase